MNPRLQAAVRDQVDHAAEQGFGEPRRDRPAVIDVLAGWRTIRLMSESRCT